METYNCSLFPFFDMDKWPDITSYIDFLMIRFSHCRNDSSALFKIIEDERNRLLSSHLPLYQAVILLVVNCVMMLFGAVASFIVILTVVRNPHMRNARNVFIVNLAASDLLLCLFSQPFNLIRLYYFYMPWIFGEVMCKLVAMGQALNMFVATLSISAIALDRFQVIIYSTRSSNKVQKSLLSLIVIWALGFLLASPVIAFSSVSSFQGEDLKRCAENIKENEKMATFRLCYSWLSNVSLCGLPLVIVAFSYLRICIRIKNRMVNQGEQRNPIVNHAQLGDLTVAERKKIREKHRRRKTKILLSTIAIIFSISWTPLSIINLVFHYVEENFKKTNNNAHHSKSSAMSENSILLINFIAFSMVLLSPCTNPFLYGYFNDNFRKEFRKMFSCLPCSSQSEEAQLEEAEPLRTYKRNRKSVPFDSHVNDYTTCH